MKIRIRKKDGTLRRLWFVECPPGSKPDAYNESGGNEFGWLTFEAAIYFATTGLHPDHRDIDPV